MVTALFSDNSGGHMKETDQTVRRYLATCTKCGANGVIYALDLDDVRKQAEQMHADFLRIYEVKCTKAVFRVCCPRGSFIEL